MEQEVITVTPTCIVFSGYTKLQTPELTPTTINNNNNKRWRSE